MGYVLALPEAMCDILLKCLIHILKAHDIGSWKIQEKVEIIKKSYFTILDKNSQKRILCNVGSSVIGTRTSNGFYDITH